MATVTALTADKTLEVLGETVTDGDVVGDNLILTKLNGDQLNAGNVRGPKGDQGAQGASAAPGDVNPTPNTTPIRTSAGQVQTDYPTHAYDATNKQYTDNNIAAAVDDILHYPVTFTGVVTFQGANVGQVIIKTAAPADADLIGLQVNNRAFFGARNGKVVVSDFGANKPISLRVGTVGDSTDEQVSIAAGGITAKGYAATTPQAVVTSIGSVVSTTLSSNVATAYGVAFVAPLSGSVAISMSAYMRSATDGIYCVVGCNVKTGSVINQGTSVYSNSGFMANANVQWVQAGGMTLVTGLTPGASYNVTAQFHASTAGTTVTMSTTQFVVLPTL